MEITAFDVAELVYHILSYYFVGIDKSLKVFISVPG